MTRAHRLRRPAEYEAVRRHGARRFRDRFFAATAARTAGQARLGIVVSRRVSNKAVTRNRIKRQIRESFRMHQSMLHGFDVVVVAQSAAAQAPNRVLAESLQNLWARLAHP